MKTIAPLVFARSQTPLALLEPLARANTPLCLSVVTRASRGSSGCTSNADCAPIPGTSRTYGYVNDGRRIGVCSA